MSVDPIRVQSLYETTLKPRLAGLEGLRLGLRSIIIKGGVLIGVPVALYWLSDFLALLVPGGLRILVTGGSFALIFVGVIVAGVKYLLPGITAYQNYKARFKQDVVSEIFKIVCPTGQYVSHQGIAQSVFVDAEMFYDQGSYASDDRVRGRIGQTPFEAAEVKRQYSTGGKNSRTVVVFHGLFFHMDFNKSLNGVTMVDPEGQHPCSLASRRGMKKVALESPDFEKVFEVWSTNEVEARYILTPAMMENLLEMKAAVNRPVYVGFRGNRAFIGVHYGSSLFEPGIASTTSLDAIQDMARQFAVAEQVVNELDLNTRIWTKGVDESLLHAPDVEKDSLEALAAQKGGTLTQEELWKTATANIGIVEAGDEVVARPSTRIQVDHSASGATVSYGLRFGFLFCLLVSSASAVGCVEALRALADEDLGPASGVKPLLAALPFIPVIGEWTRNVPVVWIIGGAIVGFLFSLGWLFHVHKVEITRDTVFISRGLRPFARKYSRPPYDKVVRLDNSVHIARADASSVFNPTASPNLSKDEAKWVASEMHRAMKQSTQGRAR